MRHTNFLTAFWLWVGQSIKSQLSYTKILRPVIVSSILAVVITSLALSRQITITAQAQLALQVPDSASLFEANAAAVTTSSAKKHAVEQTDFRIDTAEEPIVQGGTGCGWTSGTVYPITVLDNAAVNVGNNLYSFAGVSGATITANSYKFDGMSWTPIAALPAALESPAAASDGRYAYIVGGADSNGASVNTLYRYDPVANNYITLTPAPTATWNNAAVYLNGKIYKITGFVSSGGVGGTTTGSNAVDVYDIASNTWTMAANYPLALGFVSAFAQGNYLYVAGGADSVSGNGSVKTYRYDPAANTWDDASIADLPTDRWGAVTANYNFGAVLAGGFVAGAVSNTAIEWKASTNTWIPLPNMLQARARLAGGVANGAFYAVGGTPTAGAFDGTNDNQKLFCSSPTNTRLDFDGDGKTDISVFRSGIWYVQKSTGGFTSVNWGIAGDQLVPADYDGDGKTDYAVYRPTATAGALDFYVFNSGSNTFTGVEWGTTGDIAKPGNFAGDGKADFAVYRPSSNTWYILPNGGAPTITVIAGTSNAFAPLVLDYDGDGKADIAQVNNGNWYIRRSSDGIVQSITFGQAGDKFVPADYDNDNKDDLAVFRNGQWIVFRSSTSTVTYFTFGLAGDIPVPGDYDGDGADDFAVYRGGTWYINGSAAGFQAVTFGITTDIPVPSIYVQ